MHFGEKKIFCGEHTSCVPISLQKILWQLFLYMYLNILNKHGSI